MPLPCSSVVEDRSFGLLVEVVGHHRAVALLQRKQSTIDRLAGQAEGEDLALALELGQGLVDLGVLQDIEVVAVRMPQHQLDAVGTQTLEAALHREARVGGRKSKRDWPFSNSSPTLLTITQSSRCPASNGPSCSSPTP